MGIKEILANRKIRRELENEYLVVVDFFVETKGAIKKGTMPPSIGIDSLRSQCDSTRNKLETIKEQNKEVFLEFAPRFKSIFEEINTYMISMSEALAK
ncbi:MAG: hypothetical protein IJ371_00830 [Clostridia bacterium]|nr:hypothetical protein [Clostridia bacterium]